jgi:hypothetical protein
MTVSSLRKHNLAGAVVVGGALAIIGATQLWPDWSAYRATLVPERTAAPGESMEFQGQRWNVDSVRSGIGDQVVVLLRRVGVPTGEPCSGELVDGTRRWTAVLGGTLAGNGFTDACTQQGSLQLTFEIPADATPTAIDIIGPRGVILLRLMV